MAGASKKSPPSKGGGKPANTTKTKKKDASPKAATVTKAKKKYASPKTNGKQKKYYVVYTMNTGERRAFEVEKDAKEFYADFEALIVSTDKFDTKKDMNTFMAVAVAPTKKDGDDDDVVEIVHVKTMSPEEKTKFDSIRIGIENSKPKATMHFLTKTTRLSNVVIVLFNPLAPDGKPMWFFKKPFDAILANYFKESPTGDAFTDDLFTNMQHSKRRDPDKGPDAVLMSEATASNSKTYAQFMLRSWANIPVGNFASATEEQEWIVKHLNVAWNHLRNAQRTALFMNVVKESTSPSFFGAMLKKKDWQPNLPGFIHDSRVKVEQCDNLNSYLILEEVKNLQLFLFKNKLPEKKYPNDDVVVKKEPESPRKHDAPAAHSTPNKKPKTSNVTPTEDVADDDEATESEDEDGIAAEVTDNHETADVEAMIIEADVAGD